MGRVFESPLWNKIFALGFAAFASWAGYDEYQDRQSAASTEVTVNVESMPDNMGLSVLDVEAIINKAVKVERARNAGIYKKLESWEKP